MMVNPIGDVVITNDGVTILKEVDVQHPAAKMVVEVAKTQDSECGDGTTTSVVIAGELLKQAEDLIEREVVAVGPDAGEGGHHQLGDEGGQGDDHEGRTRVGPEGDKPDNSKLNQARSQDRDSLAAQESGADALPAQRLPLMITLHARKYTTEARDGVRGAVWG